jgi:hypothetical protein
MDDLLLELVVKLMLELIAQNTLLSLDISLDELELDGHKTLLSADMLLAVVGLMSYV